MAFIPCASITGGLNGTSCTPNPGGVSEVYIANFSSVVSVGASGGTVTGITGGASAFYPYVFRRNTANFQEVLTKDITTGSLFYTQTLTIVLDRMDKTKRDQLMLLDNALVCVIVKTSGGDYLLAGHGLGTKGDGMYVTTNVSQTGTAKADSNGYTITMVSEEADRASFIDPSIIAGLIGA